MIHKYSLGQMTNCEDIEKLKGTINFAIYIEPDFLDTLIRKYGTDVISQLYKIKI